MFDNFFLFELNLKKSVLEILKSSDFHIYFVKIWKSKSKMFLKSFGSVHVHFIS